MQYLLCLFIRLLSSFLPPPPPSPSTPPLLAPHPNFAPEMYSSVVPNGTLRAMWETEAFLVHVRSLQ